VALYFENSILKPDLGLLASSSAVVTGYAKDRRGASVESPADLDMAWTGGASVDGKPWPFESAGSIRLPAGRHSIQPAAKWSGLAVVDLNARLKSASVAAGGRVLFDYASDSRGIVRFDRRPSHMEVDGKEMDSGCAAVGECSVLLPRGEHRVLAAA
jgi:hypothetical protein